MKTPTPSDIALSRLRSAAKMANSPMVVVQGSELAELIAAFDKLYARSEERRLQDEAVTRCIMACEG